MVKFEQIPDEAVDAAVAMRDRGGIMSDIIRTAINAWPGMSHAHNEEGEIKDWAKWYALPWHCADASNGIILPLPQEKEDERMTSDEMFELHRLRAEVERFKVSLSDTVRQTQEQADEITALRAEVERLRAALGMFACDCKGKELCAQPDYCVNYTARAALRAYVSNPDAREDLSRAGSLAPVNPHERTDNPER